MIHIITGSKNQMFRTVCLFILFIGIFKFKAESQTTPVPATYPAEKTSSIIADKAQLQLISDQFSFTEGPATNKKGDVYFTDQPNNRIWKYSTDGKLSVFKDSAGRANGMYFDNEGNLVTCADEHNELWSITPGKKVSLLLKDFNGNHFNGPNDLWIDKKGGIYFTDPYYQRDYWIRKKPEMDGQNVYYLPKNKKAIVVIKNLMQPNGIIGTADGKYLYVADIKNDKTYRYTINADGLLTDQTLFVTKGSDGMTIDQSGNVYLTGDGVFVYNSKGELIEHIIVPEAWTANITFAGKERDLLFITASKSIYSLKMKVRGVY